jgi:hypothetical protein
MARMHIMAGAGEKLETRKNPRAFDAAVIQ